MGTLEGAARWSVGALRRVVPPRTAAVCGLLAVLHAPVAAQSVEVTMTPMIGRSPSGQQTFGLQFESRSPRETGPEPAVILGLAYAGVFHAARSFEAHESQPCGSCRYRLKVRFQVPERILRGMATAERVVVVLRGSRSFITARFEAVNLAPLRAFIREHARPHRDVT